MRQNFQKGIVSIVALGIFALLVVFGLIVANIVNQSYSNVQNNNDYLNAKALGDSALEFLEQKLKDFGPGYNSGEIVCSYNGADDEGEAAGPNEGGQNPYCENFAEMVGDEPVTITMEIKGRAEEGEALSSRRCGDGINNFANCYTVPLPGTGDAGENCELYKPAYGANGSPTVPWAVAGFDGVDQVDFACNWNKLSLGSDSSRGVTIPLYAQISEEIQSHPFIDEPNAQFYLRLRTPCNCGPNAQNCNHNACSLQDRHRLEASDKSLVDWQISGLCGNQQEECGLVGSVEGESVLTNSKINTDMLERRFRVLSGTDSSLDNSVHPPDPWKVILEKLQNMTVSKIQLTILGNLLDSRGHAIPHLEYQLLTNHPVGVNELFLIADISLNDVSIEVQKKIGLKSDIVDFAIQN